MQSSVMQFVKSKENYQFERNQFSASFPQNMVQKTGQENIVKVGQNNDCDMDDN